MKSKGNGNQHWEVIGLLFGARGVIMEFTVNVFRRFGLPIACLNDIALQILRDTVYYA